MSTAIASLKSGAPWWLRFSAKMLLTAAPVESRWLKRLALFNHGDMERPGYASAVFETHFAAYQRHGHQGGGFTCLELGPGDSLFSAILARSAGATRTWLVDCGDFALRDLELYRQMAIHAGLPYLASPPYRTTEEILAACSATYLTRGLASLRTIPSSSVDFAWSHAVLHAVKPAEFDATMVELRRVMRPGGICSHEVDLRDMFGGSLNHLRFPARLWESSWVARSGLYSNRISCDAMMRSFDRGGFETLSVHHKRWRGLPVDREKLAREFEHASEEDLLVQGFRAVLRAA